MSDAVEDIYLLSPVQQGMLFHTLLEPQSPVYFMQTAWTLHGRVDVALLKAAWEQVVGRHPVLRSACVWENVAKPVQFVLRKINKLPFAEHDWRAADEEERRRRLEEFLLDDERRGISLSQAPLFRLNLIRLADETYKFVFSAHHLLLDGWSKAAVFTEVLSLYQAQRRGVRVELGRPRPYGDYIAWLRRQDMAAAEAFWREQLKGFDAPTPLVSCGPRKSAAAGPHGFDERERRLPADLTEALQQFARRFQLTLNTLVQGAWALLLSRYADAEEVLFGVTVAGRPADLAGAAEMVGLFINTLPLRVRVPEQAKLVDWLRRLQQQAAQLREYEHTPLSDIHRWSELGGGASLFESIVVFENFPIDAVLRVPLEELRVGDVRNLEHTNYPLTLVAAPDGGTLSLLLKFDAARFGEAAVEGMLRQLERLLEGALSRPETTLSRLPFLPADEEQRILFESNRDASAYPQEHCLHELFERQAARTPEAEAVVCGEQRLSYGELDRRAGLVAARLRALGAGPETQVGVMLGRSAGLVVAILGVLKSGAAYVPLDPAYPAERRRYVAEDAGLRLVLADPAAGVTPPPGPRVLELSDAGLLLEDGADSDTGTPSGPGRVSVSPDNAAYVIYTSGSTGRPKGVVVTHSNVARLFAATEAEFGFGPRDTWALFHSPAFDFSVWELWGALLYGARLVVVPYAVTRAPGEWLSLLRRERVTVLNQTPSAFRQLAAEEARGGGEGLWPGLRLVVFGGEALEAGAVRGWAGRHGLERPRLINMYGITETTVHVTLHEVGRAEVEAGGGVGVGRPLGDLQLYVVGRGGTLLPAGAVGELCVGGAGLARGYLGRPGLTAERFVPDPFSTEPGARLYRSGDVGRRLPGGDVEYLGRLDQQVKVRGFRIEPGEVEAALREHEAVREAVVIVREDTPGEKALAAYVVPNEEPGPPADELRRHLQGKLPDYMVPASFTRIEAIPLTPNGKLDKRALPAPSLLRAEGRQYVAPRGETESVIAAVWQEVLGVTPVGILDNYFALGGDSIRAIQVANKIREYDLPVNVMDVLSAPTVAELARAVSGRENGGGTRAVPLDLVELPEAVRAAVPFDAEDVYPAALMQELMLSQYERDGAREGVYHFQQSYHLADDSLSIEALRRALELLVRRHPVLRTVFIKRDGAPTLQAVRREARPAILVEDVRGLGEAQQERAVEAALRADRSEPFRADDPDELLLRFRILVRSEQSIEFVFSIHHAIYDGWSNVEFLKELLHLYRRLKRGEEPPFEAAPNSYREFVALEQEILASEEAASFWRGHLTGECGAELGRPAGAAGGTEAGGLLLELDAELTDGLRRLSRGRRVSLKAVFLSAYCELVAAVAGRPAATVGVVSNGRSERLSDPLGALGLFWNLIPFCAGAEAARPEVVQKLLIEAEAHARYPLPRILADQNKAELFFATFNYTSFHNAASLSVDTGLRVLGVKIHDKFHFPLNYLVSAEPADGSVSLRVEYDRHYFGGGAVRSQAETYLDILKRHAGAAGG